MRLLNLISTKTNYRICIPIYNITRVQIYDNKESQNKPCVNIYYNDTSKSSCISINKDTIEEVINLYNTILDAIVDNEVYISELEY